MKSLVFVSKGLVSYHIGSRAYIINKVCFAIVANGLFYTAKCDTIDRHSVFKKGNGIGVSQTQNRIYCL